MRKSQPSESSQSRQAGHELGHAEPHSQVCNGGGGGGGQLLHGPEDRLSPSAGTGQPGNPNVCSTLNWT